MTIKANDQHVDFRLALKPVGSRRSDTPPSPLKPTTTTITSNGHSPPDEWQQIRDLLVDIEAQTKQTGIDVGQLWERSKHNNLSLQRLVAEIAEYSNEVTTEGNATKQDIHDLLAKFDQLRAEVTAVAAAQSSSSGGDDGVKSQLHLVSEMVTELSQRQLSREAQLQAEIDHHKLIINTQAETIAAYEKKLGLLEMLDQRYQALDADYRAKYADFELLRRQYEELTTDINQLQRLLPDKQQQQALDDASVKLEEAANTSFTG